MGNVNPGIYFSVSGAFLTASRISSGICRDSSVEEYTTYVRETHQVATFEATSHPSEQREILERITVEGSRYNQHKPLLAALNTLLDCLGLNVVTTPNEGTGAFSYLISFRHRVGFDTAGLELCH